MKVGDYVRFAQSGLIGAPTRINQIGRITSSTRGMHQVEWFTWNPIRGQYFKVDLVQVPVSEAVILRMKGII